MESITALAGYLQQTMSPDINIRKPAENYLRKLEAQPGYALGLLSLLSPSCQVGNDIKLASAIAFKISSLDNDICPISFNSNEFKR